MARTTVRAPAALRNGLTAVEPDRSRALLQAARLAFAERGYHRTRIDDICRHAGVSHGTFYLYFRNKDEALEALCRSLADQMYELVGRLDGVGPGEEGFARLREWVAMFVDTYEANLSVIQAWQAAERQERFRHLARLVLGRFTALFRDHIADSLPDGGRVDPGTAAQCLVAMLERSCAWGLGQQGGWRDREAGIDALATLLLQAIWGADRRARSKWRR